MRLAVMLVLCSLAIPSGAWSDCIEPVAKSDISFGLPFICGSTEMGETKGADSSEDNCKGRCLADRFDAGLSVTLVGEKGICITKTGDTCSSFGYPNGPVTHLVGTEECLAGLDEEELSKNERFRIAVVGIDSTAVRLEYAREDNTAVAKDIESNARRLLEPTKPTADAHPAMVLSDSPPQVLRFENVTLLLFGSKSPAWPTAKGPPVLLANNRVFRLQGWCTDEYVLFSVNNKLYLTYWNACCTCGWNCQLVYDLSGETPKLVYSNGAFSD